MINNVKIIIIITSTIAAELFKGTLHQFLQMEVCLHVIRSTSQPVKTVV